MFSPISFKSESFHPISWAGLTSTILNGGGGGRKKKKFKSWDQRQRERLEAIQKAEAERHPVTIKAAIKTAPSPYKRLDPATVKAYQNAVEAQDEEEAMHLIMALI